MSSEGGADEPIAPAPSAGGVGDTPAHLQSPSRTDVAGFAIDDAPAPPPSNGKNDDDDDDDIDVDAPLEVDYGADDDDDPEDDGEIATDAKEIANAPLAEKTNAIMGAYKDYIEEMGHADEGLDGGEFRPFLFPVTVTGQCVKSVPEGGLTPSCLQRELRVV